MIKSSIAKKVLDWSYDEEIERLKHTPLYADGRFAKAVAIKQADPSYDTVLLAHQIFDPDYSNFAYLKKAELLTNIDHGRVDTIAH